MAVRDQHEVCRGDLFMPAGHLGLCSSHGSVTMRFPPGVVITNVECPYHVIGSFCIAMELLCYHCGDFDNHRARTRMRATATART